MTINKEGYKIITVTAIAVVIFNAVTAFTLPCWLFAMLLAATIFFLGFVISFFREPKRPHVQDPDIVYAPADGRIVVREEVYEGEYFKEMRLQVSIFMSVTNVHVNWYPVSGTVDYFRHHHGKYLVAWHPKSSEQNERTTTVIDMGREKILFRQIAGYVARRVVSYAKEGEKVEQNTKCGFIKFGSRIDLLLPRNSQVLVNVEDTVTGSQTPIARLK